MSISGSSLTQKHCVPCEGGVEPFDKEKINAYTPALPQWSVKDDKAIEREFKFKNFREALTFVNNVGTIAEDENHHPDISLHGWNKVKLTLSTHAIGGLSENDFILAAKIDNLR